MNDEIVVRLIPDIVALTVITILCFYGTIDWTKRLSQKTSKIIMVISGGIAFCKYIYN